MVSPLQSFLKLKIFPRIKFPIGILLKLLPINHFHQGRSSATSLRSPFSIGLRKTCATYPNGIRQKMVSDRYHGHVFEVDRSIDGEIAQPLHRCVAMQARPPPTGGNWEDKGRPYLLLTPHPLEMSSQILSHFPELGEIVFHAK